MERSFSDVIESIENADDPEVELLDRTIEAARKRDPALADAIPKCAIPRRLDAEVIGVLRAEEGGGEENERILGALQQFSFVMQRQDGGYVYHENVRDLILAQWRVCEKRRAEFDEISGRLVAYYADQHDEAVGTAQDLISVAEVLREASFGRYLSIAAAIETGIVQAVLEALYHEVLRSGAAGYALFTRYFERHEAAGRLAVCRTLILAARENLTDTFGEDEVLPLLRWLRYWEARLERSLMLPAESVRILDQVLSETGDDVILRLWALGEKGSALHQQFLLSEASETYRQEIAEAEESQADPWNLSVSYIRLGLVSGQLDDLAEAAESYRQAVESARRHGNVRAEAYAWLGLFAALGEAGLWDEAFESAMQALDLGRTRLSSDRDVQERIASSFMDIFGRLDPMYADTAFEEACAFTKGGMDNPLPDLELREGYVNVLRASGRLKQAETTLASIEMEAAEYSETISSAELALTRGLLRESQGRTADAIESYGEIIDGEAKAATVRQKAAALTNRALQWMDQGRLDEAEADASLAVNAWEEMGHGNLAAIGRSLLASVARLRGDLADAEALIEEAQRLLPHEGSSHVSEYCRARGDVHRSKGRWADARREYSSALAKERASGDYRSTARTLTRLAAAASEEGRWAEAAEYAAEASDAWSWLGRNDAYERPADVASSDSKNARAILGLSLRDGDRREALVRARDLLQAASDTVPKNILYRLNLAYVSAELGEPGEAAAALFPALDAAPPGLRPGLTSRLATFRLDYGDKLAASDDLTGAAAAYEAARDELEGRLPPELLTAFALRLGDVRLRLGRPDEAEAAYKDGASLAREGDGGSLIALFEARLGFAAVARGNADEALDRFRLSAELRSPYDDPFWSLVAEHEQLAGAPFKENTLAEVLNELQDDPTVGGRMSRFTPQLSTPLPQGWLAKEAITVVAPDGAANLIASSEPLSEPLTSREFADAQGRTIESEFNEYRELAFEPANAPGHSDAWIRRFEWTLDDGSSVRQTQLYFVESGRGYTATATTLPGAEERFELELGQLIRGIAVTSQQSEQGPGH